MLLRLLLTCTLFAILGSWQPVPTPTQDRPPNIIFLLADDLGYGDLSCYGSPHVETPNLDALAARGVKFTQFYAGSAVCSPSRAAMMTGRFPLRFDIRQHFTDRGQHLPEGTVTLPHLLKQAGYATAHIGKWHLGGVRRHDIEAREAGRPTIPGPLEHGFDHYLVNVEDSTRQRLLRTRRLYRDGGQTMIRNDAFAPPVDKHWTELKVDEAIGLMEQYHTEDRPFFLNVWFDVPHTPFEPAPEPHLSKYAQRGVTGDQLLFRSMVSHLDAQIGRLLDRLDELGLAENTLVVFTSDNGPAYQGSPGPFRGGKTDLHEGGIRVPMMASWPGQIPAGEVSFQTTHMADWLPTFAALTGVEHESDVDGINLLPHLLDGTSLERNVLLWQMDLYRHYQNQGPKPEPYATTVALKGFWKLLADSLDGTLTATELFNLEQDHRELYNLLGEHPDVEAELLEALNTFHRVPRQSWR